MPTPSGVNLAVFFHMRLSGNGVELGHAIEIYQEILSACVQSGLLDAADEFVIGSSGGDANFIAACSMSPPKAKVVANAEDSVAELPTIKMAHEWSKANNGYVIYFHGKGSLHNGATKPTWEAWRRCMSNVVIWNWRACCKDLDQGFDAAGPHWLTTQQYPFIGATPYFAGNFWTANTRYLRTLPDVDIHANRYVAELWIGYGKRKIAVRPYANHFPMNGCV